MQVLRTQPRPRESETPRVWSDNLFSTPSWWSSLRSPNLENHCSRLFWDSYKFGSPQESPREVLKLMMFRPKLYPIKLESRGWGWGCPGLSIFFFFNAFQLHQKCSEVENHVYASSDYECGVNFSLEECFLIFACREAPGDLGRICLYWFRRRGQDRRFGISTSFQVMLMPVVWRLYLK